VVLRSPRALRRLLWRPTELGLGRTWVAGELDVVGDLHDALESLWSAAGNRTVGRGTRARAAMELVAAAARLGGLGPPLPRPPQEARLMGPRYGRRRSRAAVAYHYDLGNDFYRRILDERMVYSCAYWRSDAPGYDLADAQRDKLDLVCRKLALGPGSRLLDLGCGWGGLLLHAATEYGATCVGITLSQQQAQHIRARIAERGLAGSVEVRLQDHRDVDGGPYDAVASIELGEHVGRAGHPAFAARLRGLVRPGGRVLVQQMSRPAPSADGGAFVAVYVCPDLDMRPLGTTLSLLEGAGLEVRDVEAMREHYALTIDAWANELDRAAAAGLLPVDDATVRVWRLYLAGARLAFEQDRMGVDQIVAVPRQRASIPPRVTPAGRSALRSPVSTRTLLARPADRSPAGAR